MSLEHDIVAAVRRVCGEGYLPLHAPTPPHSVLITPQTIMEYGDVEEFEKNVARIMGFDFCIATVNGTAALECAVSMLVPEGGKVIVPAMTFAATASAVVRAGSEPVFVDCTGDGWLAPEGVYRMLLGLYNKGTLPKAIIVTHLLGRPANLYAIRRECEEFGIPLIEDACQAFGSLIPVPKQYRGQFAAVSFNLNKIVTTGGGGALLTSDPDLAKRARHLCTTARVTHSWEVAHDAVGWNFRMPNVNAAIGNAQIAKLDRILEAKAALADRYEQEFRRVLGCRFVTPALATPINHWLNTIELFEPSMARYVFAALHNSGIQARELFMPLPMLEPYKKYESDGAHWARILRGRTICLPSGAALGERWL